MGILGFFSLCSRWGWTPNQPAANWISKPSSLVLHHRKWHMIMLQQGFKIFARSWVQLVLMLPLIAQFPTGNRRMAKQHGNFKLGQHWAGVAFLPAPRPGRGPNIHGVHSYIHTGQDLNWATANSWWLINKYLDYQWYLYYSQALIQSR